MEHTDRQIGSKRMDGNQIVSVRRAGPSGVGAGIGEGAGNETLDRDDGVRGMQSRTRGRFGGTAMLNVGSGRVG